MKSNKASGTEVLWGELPARETHKQEIITPDIIENMWRQVMDESNSTDCDYQMDCQPEYIQLPVGNMHVLNTINLHQHLRTMEDGVALGNNSTVVAELQNSLNTKEFTSPFHFIPTWSDRTKFKEYTTVQHLKPATIHSLLRHAVIVLLAHIGFEHSSDIAVETLTDVVEHFLKRMTLLLKIASEQKDHGFPDAIEKVLLETGVGGVAALNDYYQEYVLRYERNMKFKVERMAEEQRRLELSASSNKLELDETTNKLKFEEIDEFGNMYREVPTLQLLDPDMGFPQSLDAGFQMLHSLEQDELNSLEVEEEDVNVSDSPNTGQQQRCDILNDKKKKI